MSIDKLTIWCKRFKAELLMFGLLGILSSTMAWAVDGGTVTSAPNPDGPDLSLVAQFFFTQIHNKQWGPAAAAAVVLIVFLIRQYDQYIPIVGPWLDKFFNTKPGGILLAFATTSAGALGSALLAGAKIDAALLEKIFLISSTSSAVWGWLKDYSNHKAKLATASTSPTASTATKAVAILLTLSLYSAQARALEWDWSAGPSIPLINVRIKDPVTGTTAVSLLSAGVGYQIGFQLFPQAILGKQYHLLGVSLLILGESTPERKYLAPAGLLCTLENFLCLGAGVDLIADYNGVLSGLLPAAITKENIFTLAVLSVNFGLGPYTPPIGIAKGAAGLPKGNTIYFGW